MVNELMKQLQIDETNATMESFTDDDDDKMVPIASHLPIVRVLLLTLIQQAEAPRDIQKIRVRWLTV